MSLKGIVTGWIVDVKMLELIDPSIRTTRATSGTGITFIVKDSEGAMRRATGSTHTVAIDS
jgi:hypothetical protein